MAVSVFDVAAYILQIKRAMPALKLQKLVYYSQAWSLVWDEEPLFNEKIEAWANGPVVRELFNVHRGKFKVDAISDGNAANLNSDQKDTIESVIKYYGSKSSQWLSDLTHMEEPWQLARKGIPEGEPSTNEITLESMAGYYESLSPKDSCSQ